MPQLHFVGPEAAAADGELERASAHRVDYQAAQLVRFGVPRLEALRSVTLTAAEILGLQERMGSIEVGKDANLALFSGDPLDARSWVEIVLIEGKEVYRRDKDPDLELLLKDPKRAF